MQIILEPYIIPERGTFQIQETITIQISAEEARRQVDHWLLHEVNSQMSAGQPALVVGEQSVWRVPIARNVPHIGRVGIVGIVEVDVLSGEMDISSQRKRELIQRAEQLASELPPYQPGETPVEFLVTHVVPTRQPGRPFGDPCDLPSKSS
jgi:hypothetical protein